MKPLRPAAGPSSGWEGKKRRGTAQAPGGGRASSTRRGFVLPLLAALFAALAAVGAAHGWQPANPFAAAAADDAPLRIRRVYVPYDLPVDQWPVGGRQCLPVAAEKFEQQLRAARGAEAGDPGSQVARLGRAVYSARLAGDDLVDGRGEIEVQRLQTEPGLLSVPDLKLPLSNPRWRSPESPKAWIGPHAEGQQKLVVESTGPLVFEWTLRGRRFASDHLHFSLALARSNSSRVELDLPADVRPAPSVGILEEVEAAARPGWRRWAVELGGQPRCELKITPADGGKTASASTLIREVRTYEVSPAGLELGVRLDLETLQGALSQVRLRLDPDLRLTALRDQDAPLSWTEVRPAGPPSRTVKENDAAAVREVVVDLSGRPSRRRTLSLRAYAPLILDRAWKLPSIKVLGGVWQEGRATLRVPGPFSIQQLQLPESGGQPLARQAAVGALPGPAAGVSIGLEYFSPDAAVSVRLASKERLPQALSASSLVWRSDVISAETVVDLVAAEGRTFLVEADLGPRWIVESVTTQPSDWLANWRVASVGPNLSRLELQLARGVALNTPLRVVVQSRLTKPPLDEPFSWSQLVPLRWIAGESSEAWIGVAAQPPIRLEWSFPESSSPRRLSDLSPAWRQRFRGGSPERVSPAAGEAAEGTVTARRPPARLASRWDLSVAITPDGLWERGRLLLTPDPDAPFDQLQVSLPPGLGGEAEWRLEGDAEMLLRADRVDSAESETWRLAFRPAPQAPVRLRYERARPLAAGLRKASLPSLLSKGRHSGTVTVEQWNLEGIDVRASGLVPIPPPRAAEGGVSPWTRRAFSYQVEDSSAPGVLEFSAPRDARLPPAIARDGRLEGVVVPGRHIVYQYSATLENLGRESVSCKLPAEAKLEQAWLGEQAAAVGGGSVRFVWPKTERLARLRLVYRQPWPTAEIDGKWRPIWPELDVPTLVQKGRLTVAGGGWRLSTSDSWWSGAGPDAFERLFGPSTAGNSGGGMWGESGGWGEGDSAAVGAGWAAAAASNRGLLGLGFVPDAWLGVPKAPERLERISAWLQSLPYELSAPRAEEPLALALERSWRAAVGRDLPLGVLPEPLRSSGFDGVMAAQGAAERTDDWLVVCDGPRRLLATREWGRSVADRLLPTTDPQVWVWRGGEVEGSESAASGGDDAAVSLAAWRQGGARRLRPAPDFFAGGAAQALASAGGEGARRLDEHALSGAGLDLPPGRDVQLVRGAGGRPLGWLCFAAACLVFWGWEERRATAAAFLAAFLATVALTVPADYVAIPRSLFWGVVFGWLLKEVVFLIQATLDRPSPVARSAAFAVALLLAAPWQGSEASAGRLQGAADREAQVGEEHLVFIPRRPPGATAKEAADGGTYMVPLALARELRRREERVRAAPTKWLWRSARYEVRPAWDAELARFTLPRLSVRLEGRRFTEEAVFIPLPAGAAVERPRWAREGRRQVELTESVQPPGLFAPAGEPGEFELEFELSPKTHTAEALSWWDLAILPTLEQRLVVHPAPAGPTVECSLAQGASAADAKRGVVETQLGPLSSLFLQWRNDSQEPLSPKQVQGEVLGLLKILPGNVILDVKLRLNVAGGSLRQLTVAADSRLEPLRPWTGAGLAQSGPPIDDGELTRLGLAWSRPMNGVLLLDASYLLQESSGVGRLRIPTIELPGVAVQRSWLGIYLDPSLELDGRPKKEVAAEAFQQAWNAAESFVPGQAVDWSAAGKELKEVAVRPRKPRRLSREELRLALEPDRTSWEFRADVMVSESPCFHHRFLVPAECQIEEATLSEYAAQRSLPWFRDSAESITVSLPAAGLGPQRLQVKGWMRGTAQGQVAPPLVALDQAECEQRVLRVYRSPRLLAEQEISSAAKASAPKAEARPKPASPPTKGDRAPTGTAAPAGAGKPPSPRAPSPTTPVVPRGGEDDDVSDPTMEEGIGGAKPTTVDERTLWLGGSRHVASLIGPAELGGFAWPRFDVSANKPQVAGRGEMLLSHAAEQWKLDVQVRLEKIVSGRLDQIVCDVGEEWGPPILDRPWPARPKPLGNQIVRWTIAPSEPPPAGTTLRIGFQQTGRLAAGAALSIPRFLDLPQLGWTVWLPTRVDDQQLVWATTRLAPVSAKKIDPSLAPPELDVATLQPFRASGDGAAAKLRETLVVNRKPAAPQQFVEIRETAPGEAAVRCDLVVLPGDSAVCEFVPPAGAAVECCLVDGAPAAFESAEDGVVRIALAHDAPQWIRVVYRARASLGGGGAATLALPQWRGWEVGKTAVRLVSTGDERAVWSESGGSAPLWLLEAEAVEGVYSAWAAPRTDLTARHPAELELAWRRLTAVRGLLALVEVDDPHADDAQAAAERIDRLVETLSSALPTERRPAASSLYGAALPVFDPTLSESGGSARVFDGAPGEVRWSRRHPETLAALQLFGRNVLAAVLIAGILPWLAGAYASLRWLLTAGGCLAAGLFLSRSGVAPAPLAAVILAAALLLFGWFHGRRARPRPAASGGSSILV